MSFVPRNEPNLGENMKTKFTALALATVTALSFAPKPAQASDKGLAVLGGFIGGVIVASAINNSNHHDGYSNRTTVMVNDRCDDGPSGYWNTVAVRVWVPGCWVEVRDYNGCRTRRYVSAHYETRHDRVWVAYNNHGRNDRYDRRDRNDRDGRGRHDRDVSSGYGRDHNRR